MPETTTSRSRRLVTRPGLAGLAVSALAASALGAADAPVAAQSSSVTVTADTSNHARLAVRSFPSTVDSDVVRWLDDADTAQGYCLVAGELIDGHVRDTSQWVFVSDGFASAAYLRDAEDVPTCFSDERASRAAMRIPKPVIDKVKKLLYDRRHGKPETPNKDYSPGDTPPESPQGPAPLVGETGQLRSVNYPDFVLRADQDARAVFSATSDSYSRIVIRPGFAGEGTVSLNLPAACQYLRHVNGQLVASPYVDDPLWKQDASFYVRSAQDDRGGTAISLESVNYPGHFIRHFEGQFEIGTPDTRPGTPFASDATFFWLRQ